MNKWTSVFCITCICQMWNMKLSVYFFFDYVIVKIWLKVVGKEVGTQSNWSVNQNAREQCQSVSLSSYSSHVWHVIFITDGALNAAWTIYVRIKERAVKVKKIVTQFDWLHSLFNRTSDRLPKSVRFGYNSVDGRIVSEDRHQNLNRSNSSNSSIRIFNQSSKSSHLNIQKANHRLKFARNSHYVNYEPWFKSIRFIQIYAEEFQVKLSERPSNKKRQREWEMEIKSAVDLWKNK